VCSDLQLAAWIRQRLRSLRPRPTMLVLFDHGTPSGIAPALVGHTVVEARERGWDRVSNGDLLNAAEAAGFQVLLTTDKNIQYQQNLAGRKISVLVLENSQWPVVRLHLGSIATAVNAAKPGGYTEVEIPKR
jgi:hypothetical protein